MRKILISRIRVKANPDICEMESMSSLWQIYKARILEKSATCVREVAGERKIYRVSNKAE